MIHKVVLLHSVKSPFQLLTEHKLMRYGSKNKLEE